MLWVLQVPANVLIHLDLGVKIARDRRMNVFESVECCMIVSALKDTTFDNTEQRVHHNQNAFSPSRPPTAFFPFLGLYLL